MTTALLYKDLKETKNKTKSVSPCSTRKEEASTKLGSFDFSFDNIFTVICTQGTEPPEDFPLDLEPKGAASQGYFDGSWDSLPESEKYSVYVALWDSAVSRVLALQEEFAKSL